MDSESVNKAGSEGSSPSSSEINLSDGQKKKPCEEEGSEGSPSYSQMSFSDGQIERNPCEVCGSDANENQMMTCFRCEDTREHIYCAAAMLPDVPPMWLCEDCRGYKKSSSSRVRVVEIPAKTATSRINDEIEVNEDSIQSAQSSRMEDNENSMEVASASRANNNDQSTDPTGKLSSSESPSNSQE